MRRKSQKVTRKVAERLNFVTPSAGFGEFEIMRLIAPLKNLRKSAAAAGR